MKKIRIGIWIYDEYKQEAGGAFGYYSQLVNALYAYNFADAEVIFISRKFTSDWDKSDKSYEIKTPNFTAAALPLYHRIINKITFKFRIEYKYMSLKQGSYDLMLKNELYNVIDLMYYLTPSYEINNFPCIYTLWDIGHLSIFALPELSMNDVFESRKLHHDLIPQKALMVFCESESGKQEATKFLNLNKSRIKVVHLFPSEIISSKFMDEKPELLADDSFFIHYPAQYWSHKNHFNLLIAFQIILIKFPNLKLVLSGADKGNKHYISSLINELNLKNSVIDLGFVKIEELKWIYKKSNGLVMASLLGPTNMPLLEAGELGCPVACSHLDGHKEQLGQYGYYFDPLNPKNIAETVIEMIEDKLNGVQRKYQSNFNIMYSLDQIDKAFSEIRHVRFCWGADDQIF